MPASSAPSLASDDDKYSAFKTLGSDVQAPSDSVSASNSASSSDGDKYGAFRTLGSTVQAPVSSNSASGSNDDRYNAFGSLSGAAKAPAASNSQPTSSQQVAPVSSGSLLSPLEPLAPISSSSSSTSGIDLAPLSNTSTSMSASKLTGEVAVSTSSSALNDDFGDFSSGPPPQSSLGSDRTTSIPPPGATKPPGWADFSQFGFQPVPTTSSAGGSGTSAAASAFDDLLPKELASAKTKSKVSGDLSSGSKSTPAGTPKLGKQLSGLQSLEVETLSHFSDPVQPTALPTHVLLPEPVAAASSSTSSLDHFGDFEGFSAAKPKGDDLESNSGSVTSFTGKTKVSWLVATTSVISCVTTP